MKGKLAINGGQKVRTQPFPFCSTIGTEEIAHVTSVLSSGVLSQFIGARHQYFYGGPEVRALEKEWAKYFGVKHAISVNSATSGLICAVGASGVEPGDEVIVTPYSMSISATAPLFYSAVPVFADIEKKYFCLDSASVESKITSRTKAIIVVNLFGQPYDADRINRIARKHNLVVIEDNAQAPGARYKGKYSGTLGDIGIYSLNYHKHIQSGEGGVVVTNDDSLAKKIRLIRNHAEAAVEDGAPEDLANMLGFNFRMTEIEAAITREQLRKLKTVLQKRMQNVRYLSRKLQKIPFIEPAPIRKESTHVFYALPFFYDEKKAGISRNKFIEAVNAELTHTEKREAEGVRIGCGYVKPIYLLPLFQKQICFGRKGYPFTLSKKRIRLYKKGMCPVTEQMHEKNLFLVSLLEPCMTKQDLDDIVKSFYKVWENLDELK